MIHTLAGHKMECPPPEIHLRMVKVTQANYTSLHDSMDNTVLHLFEDASLIEDAPNFQP